MSQNSSTDTEFYFVEIAKSQQTIQKQAMSKGYLPHNLKGPENCFLLFVCLFVCIRRTSESIRKQVPDLTTYLRLSIVIFAAFKELSMLSMPECILMFHVTFRPREIPLESKNDAFDLRVDCNNESKNRLRLRHDLGQI